MKLTEKTYEIHKFYNLTRYLFLKIEYDYSTTVELSGITLPQLRVLWIINSFPGISLGKIAKFGSWTSPTVSNILKILNTKKLVLIDKSEKSKFKNIHLTNEGFNYIEKNKQKDGANFQLFKLMHSINKDDLSYIIDTFKKIITQSNNSYIFEYIDKINELSLKIDYVKFDEDSQKILKNLVELYNVIRIFVLKIENEHSLLLRDIGLTYPQLRALIICNSFEGITSMELSKMGLWSPSTANLIVRNLFNKNLVYKRKGSVKNTIHIYITENGRQLVIRDFKENQNRIKLIELINKFDNEELRKSNEILSILNSTVKNHMIMEYISKTCESYSDGLESVH